jgi:hypothetical protein
MFRGFKVGEVGVSGVEELSLLVVVVRSDEAGEFFEFNLSGLPLEVEFTFLGI